MLVEMLREAAGDDTRIVRYSNGAPSAIDVNFDAVVDAQGIRALLAGAAEISAPAWRRTRSELTVFESARTSNGGARPTIAGPARGCPFLVDVRTSPAYRDSGIDFGAVQSKGCAFCLDNLGAFVVLPEEIVVGEWLAQLRALRQERPEVREVLLTDERPHPYLPGLFRAIVAEPALHGIELLIKSRVDWLEEYADGALREACEIAERSGSVVHVYLVGFESFHQPDLDLFNKAVCVADNLRAIETLRELEARHPRSFEFRRLRTHGFLLFHPWTTPQSLLENARIMREVRFAELRQQVLKTRLRLYPSVPLHALAERQGLLAEDFDRGRCDRAVEQGYNASVPWRFADPRIEAVFRAVNRVAEAIPDLLEADVLEMVTTFVLRWPTVARAPDLAALPIMQALLSWGSSPADVVAVAGAAIASFDREVEAVVAREKSACLKKGVPRQDADALVRAYELMGLNAAVVSTHDRGGDEGRHGRGNAHALIAVAGDLGTLDRIVASQRALERGERQHIPVMGVLMGYPSCCIEAFAAQSGQGDNLGLERAPFHSHPERSLAPMINRLGAVSLTPHMLCTPDCRPSIERAQRTLATLANIDQPAASRIALHLATPVLHLDYRRAALVEGRWDGERYIVGSLRPFHRANFGVDPSSVHALRLAPDRVVFELADNGEFIVSATAPILIEPGMPVAPPVKRALANPTGPPSPIARDKKWSSNGPAADNTDVADAPPAPGTRVGDHIVSAVEADGAGGFRVTLAKGSCSVRILMRPWERSRPAFSRRGKWALDLEVDCESPENYRRLVGALVLLLPAGHHHEGETARPGESASLAQAPRTLAKDTRPGVICTTPWTTLEVVDPDGRVRQCCSDWTVGDRGNLHTQSLLDVWNGAGYRMARQLMGGGSVRQLCQAICPRLYDGKFAEREMTLLPGAAPFVANQRILLEDIAARRDVVRGKPLYVAVCPSTYCNYDCIMCLCGRTPRRDLPEAIWDELLTMLPTLRALTLLGGEPLANPSTVKFLRTWDRVKYPDAVVALVTNGSLLVPSLLAQLERCRFHVTVSLNAGTPDVYERVQRGIALDRVLANVDALVEQRRRQNAEFSIILSFVVQPANHTTLVAFGEIARSRGLMIRLLPLSPRGPEGLDYYDDHDEVARVLASLDSMANWAKSAAPAFLREIHGTRTAIAVEATRRHARGSLGPVQPHAHGSGAQPRTGKTPDPGLP